MESDRIGFRLRRVAQGRDRDLKRVVPCRGVSFGRIEPFAGAIGPGYLDGVDVTDLSQAEMDTRITTTAKAVSSHHQPGPAVVAGDPIGAPDEVPAVLDAFLRFCETRGWIPAFYQVLDSSNAPKNVHNMRILMRSEDAAFLLQPQNIMSDFEEKCAVNSTGIGHQHGLHRAQNRLQVFIFGLRLGI